MDKATCAWQLGLPPTAALINCACLRPNGCLLALQCDPDRCVILDLTGIPLQVPSQVQVLECEQGSGLEVAACTWSPSGSHLLVAWSGGMGAVQLYQVVDGQQQLEHVLDHGLFFWPKDIAVIEDGHEGLLLAVAGAPGIILYRLTQTGGRAWQARQVRRLCHLWPACQVAAAHGHLAAAGLGGQLWVWDLGITSADAGPEEHLQLQTQIPAERVTSLTFSPDGATLAAACWGCGVFLYHKAAGSRWAGTGDTAHSDATPVSAAESSGQAAALPAQDLAACPLLCAAAGASPEEPLVSAAPLTQPLQTGPAPSGSTVPVGAGGMATKAVARVPSPVQASSLAALDHGVRGSGRWVIGKGLPGLAASAEAMPPALLAWAGDRKLAVTRAGPHFLEVLQLDDTNSLVCVAVHGASSCHSSSLPVPERCGAGGSAVGQSGGVPPGLRVLPVPEGLRTGFVEESDAKRERVTKDQGAYAAAVKGLAVFPKQSGIGLMSVTYSRGGELQVDSLGS